MQSGLGVIAFIAIAWGLSERKTAFSFSFAALAVAIQFAIAALLLFFPPARQALASLTRVTEALQQATVEATKQQLAFAKRELNYTLLLAPIDGSIARKNVEINENIQPGQPIFTLSSTGFIEVKISIPESLIGGIKKGESVLVKFDAIPNKIFQAEVHEVSAASVEGSTFPVKVRLSSVDPSLRSGMAAEVIFTFTRPTETKAIYVPLEAIHKENNETYVFVAIPIDEQLATVEKRPVKIGGLTNQGIVILEGLQSNELVITAGIHFLQKGMKVKI